MKICKCNYKVFLINESKFNVGDKVVWHNDKFRIWDIRYDTEINMYEYAIEDSKDNCRIMIVFGRELSTLKKKDELEVGDKFRDSLTGSIVEILAVTYDERIKVVRYFGEREDKLISVWDERDVKEIIYD